MASERPDPQEPFARDEGRHVFGKAAAVYAAARPDYPDRVYDILRHRCQLGPTSRVVEIGAGSGQATKRLLEAGAHVVAIEPSEALAEQLSARLKMAPGLEVVVSAFEDAELAPSSFDLVTAATAFHWLDPERALPKIATILRPGGWLAVWWNVFGDPDRPDPFHDATEPLLRDLAPSPSAGAGGPPFALDVAARTAELESHGFHDVEHEVERWTLRLDGSQARRLYETYSNIARLVDSQKEMILDEIERIAAAEFGGRVERQMVTIVYTARVSTSTTGLD
jgi:SAM-dependent methyltransferase